MTNEQCLKIVAADTRVREAARDVVAAWKSETTVPVKMSVASIKLEQALREFDRAMEEQNGASS